MTRKLFATFLLYGFGLNTVAFAAARPVPRDAPPWPVTDFVAPSKRAAVHLLEPAPWALDPAALFPLLLDGGSPQLVSCDHDAQGAVLVASVAQSTSVDFNVDPPACSGDPDLCGAFSYDKSGPTPDTWKAIFDVGGKKLRIETGATVRVVNVPAASNNQKAPGLEIKSSCGLEVQAGASVIVGSLNQPAGDIFIKIDGDVRIDGTIRNSVSGTNGTPGKITIASCFGDLVTGPQSRIETIGVAPGGKDINLLTCPVGGDVSVSGLVRAVHTYGATPNVNVVSFGGAVTIDGRNDFGEEVESGTTIRRTSGILARTTNATAAGKVRVQAKHDVTVLGNRILDANRTQYGAVAVKPHSTNGQGGDGDLLVRSLEGRIVASDRAFDFANRFNALNAISLEAKDTIELSVTAAINAGAADNAKAVVSAQGGSAGQGGTNTLRSFSGQITIGQNAQVLANFTGTPGANGSNALIACGGVLNSGTVTPTDANLSDDSGTCTPAAPIPLFTSCEDFGVFPPTGPQNQPPAVDAGPDLNVTLPAAAALDATVSDDGLPPGGSLAASWAKLSGPGPVVFGNPSAVDTTATFSVAGTYELRLTVTDSELSRSDDITVFVGAANQAPAVDAGPDQTITLPTNSVTLNGIVSDDGLPASSSLVIAWSVVSGPGSVTFGSPNAPSTTAAFQVQGTHELRLSATDGALFSSDTVLVTVVSPPPPQTEASGFVSGLIVDRGNSEPLAGVQVKMRGVSGIVLTDAAGRFTYPTPGTGSFTVFLERAGYVTARRDASVVSQRHASVGTIPLAALDTASTVITPAGGTHSDSTGKLQAIFPPGAVDQAISVSATTFPLDRDFPLPIPEGIVFVAGVQMTPEHTSFLQPVTLRFTNELGLAAGTQVPFAFASHDEEDTNEGFYDPGIGVVSADGAFIEAVVSHFSCVSLGLKPPQGQSNGGSCPTCGQPPGAKKTCSQNNSGPLSSICISDGGVRLEQRLASVGALGGRDGLEFSYSSLTAFPRPLVTARSQLGELFFNIPPERQTWTVAIEGVERQFSFQGTTQASHFTAFWDGLNAAGSRAPTGVYDYLTTATAYFPGPLFSSDSFGSLPTTSTNVASQQALPYSAPAGGQLIFNDQSTSPFGAGWNLSELERLYPQPTGTVLWTSGNGNEAVMRPGKREPVASGLGRSGGLARDAQGNLYVGDFSSGTIQKVAPDGSVTSFASIESGLSDLAFDRQGILYALSYFGRLFRVSSAGEPTLFATFGFDLGDLVVAPSGDVFVIDSHHPKIYRVTPAGQVGLFTGYSFVIGGGLLTYPSGIVMDAAGNLYISNNYNVPGAPVRCGVSFISKISPNGNHGYYAVDLNAPRGLALDAKGNLYVADAACDGSNGVSIKMVSPTGGITTLEKGFSGLGPSTLTPYGFSNDLVADDAGTLYLVTETGELFQTHEAAPPTGVKIDYEGPASEFGTLVRHEDGSFTRTETDGTRGLFNAQGRQTARIETDGDAVSYAYDPQGRLISRTNAVGQVWSFDYTGSAVASVTDPAGRVTQFGIDGSGNLTEARHPDGSAVSFAYDARHLLTSKTDARGFTTSYSYDANGRATEVNVATGETRRFDAGRVRVAVENLAPGVGTPGNPAPPVLTADLEDRYTDGRNLTTRYVSNGFGSLTRTVRPDGVVHEIERDVDNQPTLLREPNGGNVRQKYDAKGNLLEYDQESGLFYRIFYHPVFSKPIAIDDALGQVGRTTFQYDTGGHLIETTDPRLATTRYTRDAHGLPTRVELPDGAVVEYTYDGFGRVITSKDALARVTTFEYDAAGNPTKVTDPAGRETRYSYDGMNRRTSALDALNGATTFVYQAACTGCDNNQEVLTSLTDAKGQTTTLEYDAIGQLTSSTDALGRSRSFSYDLNRNLTSVTDAKGQTIGFEYDANDRLIRKLRPEASVDYGYDAVGNLISLSDENSSMALAYDVANRLIRTTAGGLLPPVPIENAYDRRNLRTSQTAPWNSLSYGHDAAGHLDLFSGIPGALPTLSFIYDPLNRRRVTSGLVAESLAYDLAGQLLFRGSSDAAAALAWQYAYDALGNRTSEVRRETFRSAAPVITATPDPSTAPTATIHIEGKTSWPAVRVAGIQTIVGLDGRFFAQASVSPGPNEVLVEALSAAGVVAASHTLSITGEPVSGIELSELLGGESAGGVFASRPGSVVKVAPDGTIDPVPGLDDGSFTVTHVARASDGTLWAWSGSQVYHVEGDQAVLIATAPFVPEDVGQIADGTWALTQSGDPTLYRFDPATGQATPWITTLGVTGSLRLATNTSGEVVVGSEDGKVFRVSPTGDVTEWTAALPFFAVRDVALDDAGNATIAGLVGDPAFCAEAGDPFCLGLRRLLPGGQVEALEGNPGRIMSDGPGSLYFLGFRVLLRIPPGATTPETISLAPPDLVIQVEIDPPTEIARNFGYDSLDRLTAADPGESYAYDGVGNRTLSHLSEIQVYDAANQLLEDDNFTYAYDANGNLTSKVGKLGGSATSYTWDSEDRLVRVALPGTVADYVYDPLGRRIQKTVNGEVTRYLYDGEDIVAELDAANTVLTSFIHGPGTDEPLAMARVGRTYTYHRDALGSITHITDDAGLVVQRYAYDAYGNVSAELDPDFVQPYGFTGRERDRETGLLYYRARYYDPKIGRFLSEDPIGFRENANFYTYVKSNPVNLLDPFGQKVTNNTSGLVYVKPENSGTAVPLPPGQTYPGNQDGIAVPDHRPNDVYKTTDGIDATVNPDGSVTTSGGPIDSVIQYIRGGWKDEAWVKGLRDKGDKGWDDLLNKSRSRKAACLRP